MGSPFANFLDSKEVSEPLVDCARCKVSLPLTRFEEPGPYKCCDFQPFWSLFSIAERLSSGLGVPRIPKGAILLPVGIVPGPLLRKGQEDTGAVKAPCGFLDRSTLSCMIFEHRPLECRRYYCATAQAKRETGRLQVHNWASGLQMRAMYEFLVVQGAYSVQSWQSWVEYLDPEGWRGQPDGEFESLGRALEFYERSFAWWDDYLSRVEPPGEGVLWKAL